MSGLSFDERETLKTIVDHGGPNLLRNLEMYTEWVHDLERAKINRQVHPQFPLVLLSLMGIYGRDSVS